MQLTTNESQLLIFLLGTLFTIFLSVVTWILNKGVNKMENMASSLNNMERDFKVLVNDHTNLKEDVKEIDKRVRHLETI